MITIRDTGSPSMRIPENGLTQDISRIEGGTISRSPANGAPSWNSVQARCAADLRRTTMKVTATRGASEPVPIYYYLMYVYEQNVTVTIKFRLTTNVKKCGIYDSLILDLDASLSMSLRLKLVIGLTDNGVFKEDIRFISPQLISALVWFLSMFLNIRVGRFWVSFLRNHRSKKNAE